MSTQVEASTVSAGAFFAANRFRVPDYQRKYSWTDDEQIADFWRDLSDAIGRGEYFLGLIVLSDTVGPREIVDGQQRLVTLTILANELRLIASSLGRRLVGESIRTDFLYSMDYKTEEQYVRIELTDENDREDLQVLLDALTESDLELRSDSGIHKAHEFFARSLRMDLEKQESPALRLGEWAEFIAGSLTFAVFAHPNRSAAFRVYEVINTRGKVLTPTELIKSHVIGSSDSASRDSTYNRWNAIEAQLDSLGAADQITAFVRHVVTLDRGYVIPKNLYQVVSRAYTGSEGVDSLLDKLESSLGTYTQMIDPAADIESTETRTKAFVVADALSLSRFRPILLAATATATPDEHLEEVIKILIPGSLTGRFGTGSFEAQFARAARRVSQEGKWDEEVSRLRDLRPTREEFILRFARGVSKSQAHVMLSAFNQRVALPELLGYPHQVRPRNAERWSGFDFEEYRETGGLLGNWLLTPMERRPQGTRTPELVRARIVPNQVPPGLVIDNELDRWTVQNVRERSGLIAARLAEIYYETE